MGGFDSFPRTRLAYARCRVTLSSLLRLASPLVYIDCAVTLWTRHRRAQDDRNMKTNTDRSSSSSQSNELLFLFVDVATHIFRGSGGDGENSNAKARTACIAPVNRNGVQRSHSRNRIFVLLTKLSGAETDDILSDRQEPKHVGHVRLSERIED